MTTMLEEVAERPGSEGESSTSLAKIPERPLKRGHRTIPRSSFRRLRRAPSGKFATCTAKPTTCSDSRQIPSPPPNIIRKIDSKIAWDLETGGGRVAGVASPPSTESDDTGREPADSPKPNTAQIRALEFPQSGSNRDESLPSHTMVERHKKEAVRLPRSEVPTSALHSTPDFQRSQYDASRLVSSASGGLTNKTYNYARLEKGDFRLVKILATRNFQMECEILHAYLREAPDYMAMSYAWGDPADSAQIKIRDDTHHPIFVEVPIPKSLYLAMRALRKKNEEVLVWADALSIDQQNREEKNQQLPLMTDIYKNARSVAVWLGPEARDSELATQLLQDVAAAAEAGTDRGRFRDMIYSRPNALQSLSAVASMFSRDYWSRLWVVQEISNAAEIPVYCGIHS